MITQIDTNLWRGPRPDSMDELKAIGIQQIINLEVGWFEAFHGKEGQEKEQAFTALISYEHCPISDWMFPTKKELDKILDAIRIASSISDSVRTTTRLVPGKCYVHCLHGFSRTGLVIASYRVKNQGWPIDKAIQEMLDMGFEVFPYKYLGWIDALMNYLKCPRD